MQTELWKLTRRLPLLAGKQGKRVTVFAPVVGAEALAIAVDLEFRFLLDRQDLAVLWKGRLEATRPVGWDGKNLHAHPGETVLVVSHKATLRLILSSLLGFDPRGYRDRLDQSPACLNVVDFCDPVRARLMSFNDTSHYASRPRPPTPGLSRWWDGR